MKPEMRRARELIQAVEQWYEGIETRKFTRKTEAAWYVERHKRVFAARRGVRRCIKIGTKRELQSLLRFAEGTCSNWIAYRDSGGDDLVRCKLLREWVRRRPYG